MENIIQDFIKDFIKFDIQTKSDFLDNEWLEILKSDTESNQKIEIFTAIFPYLTEDLKIKLWNSSESLINSYDAASRASIISKFIEHCDLALKTELFKNHSSNVKYSVENLQNIDQDILKVFENLEVEHKKSFIDTEWMEILRSNLITKSQKTEIFKNIYQHLNLDLQGQLSKILEDLNTGDPSAKISAGMDFVYNKFPQSEILRTMKEQLFNEFKEFIDSNHDEALHQDAVVNSFDEL